MRKLILSLGLASALALQACGNCEFADIADEASERAGSSATNCGDIGIGGNVTDAFACVSDAFNAHRAFRVTVTRQGIDSQVAVGWASDASGNVFRLHFDSDRSGGSGDGGIVTVDRCQNASLAGGDPSVLVQGAFFACSALGPTERTCGD